MTIYQVAETLGWTAERVRSKLSGAELCEWSVYLNTPFSGRSREAMMNGWLVHTIRSIVASKNKRPKLADSIFPFDKVYKGFFTSSKPVAPAQKGKLATTGEVGYMSQIWRKRYEQAMAEYRAGRTVNKFGLKYGETMAH